jgi:hypothetical protein
MTIEFKKIPSLGTHFEAHAGTIRFSGDAVKHSKTLVKCVGALEGEISHVCDRCAEIFTLKVNEAVEVFASEGIYHDQEGDELLNVVEFFDGVIDFNTLRESELEAFKSDYHYCGSCKNIELNTL